MKPLCVPSPGLRTTTFLVLLAASLVHSRAPAKMGDATTSRADATLIWAARLSLGTTAPKQLLRVSMHRTLPQGGTQSAALLRTARWVRGLGLKEGESFEFDASEPSFNGKFIVDRIEPTHRGYAESGALDARMVTGTFETENAQTYTLTLEDGTKIRGTKDHPLWSLDRNRWVGLGSLHPGELLVSQYGPVQVRGLHATIESEMVFNIEVDGVHRYLVSERGVLSHNVYENAVATNKPIESEGRTATTVAPRPFWEKSEPDEYRARWGSTEISSEIEGSIGSDGFLEFAVFKDRLVQDGPTGSDMFNTMFESLGPERVHGIRAQWYDKTGVSDNYRSFKRAQPTFGEFAYWKTWTGKMAYETGFTVARLVKDYPRSPLRSAYVEVEFERPSGRRR